MYTPTPVCTLPHPCVHSHPCTHIIPPSLSSLQQGAALWGLYMPGHWPAPLKREFPTATSGFSPQLCHALLGIFILGHLFLRLLGQLADSLMKTSVLRSLIGGYPFPPVPQLFLAFPPLLSHSFTHQASFMEGPPTGTGPLVMPLPGSSPCSLHNFNLIAQKPNPREWSWPQPPTWNSC